MKININPSHKLTPIEGLRGYLALVVILQHLINETGYNNSVGPLKSVGSLAVKCFIIISGFVIFFLIDTRREPYRIYITRRIFRIFPACIILFLCSIPCSVLAHSVMEKCASLGWFSPQEMAEQTQNYFSIWRNLQFHVPAHLLMIHGLIPEHFLPGSPTAFLGPAWSLSLEWQFYLIAPIWFFLFTTESVWKRILMYAFCLMAIVGCNRYFSWYSRMDAALPFYIEFFFFGIVSYFLYRTLIKLDAQRTTIFPIVFILCLVIYKWSGKGTGMIPFLFWASFFALILEPASSISSRYITPVFTNPISLWLGKISFSLYLSHALVIILLQWELLSWFPNATQAQHLMMLAPLTLVFTTLVSAVLYYSVEAPFIKLGAKLVKKMSANSTPEPTKN